MNAAGLLKHYERIADAPDAVAKLRRLILDLAVRGKLVPQDLNDEPVPELLKRIAAEKLRLVKAGYARDPKAIPANNGAPFPLPKSWRWSQIAAIGLLNPRNEASDAVSASFVPMSLIAAEYGVGHGHEVRPWSEVKKGYTHFAEGDVGLAKITPCFENGKSTVFRDLTGGVGAGTTELHVARPLFVDPDFILAFFKSPHFIETGIPKMTGTAGQKRVPGDYFAHSPFPLPPLAEQRRIVAKVDELMALCDQLEAARAEREARRDRLAAATLARLNVPDPETFHDDARFALEALSSLTARSDQIQEIRQTILNLAVCGKLVPQFRDDEPASVLVTRIQRYPAHAARSGVQNCEPQNHGLPINWTAVDLASIATVGTGLTPSRAKPEYFDPPVIPWVTSGETSTPFITSAAQYVSPLALRETSLKVYPSGTLLIAMYGQGKTRGQVAELQISAATNQACAAVVLTLDDDGHRRYVKLFFEKMYDEIRELSAGGAQPNLNVGKIKSTVVPLPPLAEQRRIVARVDELMALCDRLQASLDVEISARGRLLDAILHEALERTGAAIDAT